MIFRNPVQNAIGRLKGLDHWWSNWLCTITQLWKFSGIAIARDFDLSCSCTQQLLLVTSVQISHVPTNINKEFVNYILPRTLSYLTMSSAASPSPTHWWLAAWDRNKNYGELWTFHAQFQTDYTCRPFALASLHARNAGARTAW